MRRLVVVLVLVWPLPTMADLSAGVEAYERGDYETAYREFLPEAEAGDAGAQNNIGYMHAFGLGVPQDHHEAAKWFRRAAEQGFAAAQNNVGYMHSFGLGVPQNHREAAKWYRRAAEQGVADAQTALGWTYGNGDGVPEDHHEAAKWYRRAAEQGVAFAQFKLGAYYLAGQGVPEDYQKALKWCRRAAQQGDAYGQDCLGTIYDLGMGIPEDDVQAYAWHNLASAQGNEIGAERKRELSRLMTASQIAEAQRVSATLAQHIKRGQPVSAATILSRPYTRAGPSPAQVMEAQQLLARLGYQPGAADGILGRKTAAATRAFQSNMDITPTGHVTEELLALLKIAVAAMASEPGREEQPNEPSQLSSGSGFFVSDAGHVVTNHHVVESCGSVTVTAAGTQQAAMVAAVDQPNDLALLKAPAAQAQPATFRQPQRAVLGESVTVAGFPLSGLLASDLNITGGTVSALAGPRNNPRFLQITAPVQLGNSGGPLLDKSGQVIGVVVGKLNAAKVFSATGDLPQNINFAIKGALVRGFLDIHGVNYLAGAEAAPLGGEAVAAKARRFVVPVACWE